MIHPVKILPGPKGISDRGNDHITRKYTPGIHILKIISLKRAPPKS